MESKEILKINEVLFLNDKKREELIELNDKLENDYKSLIRDNIRKIIESDLEFKKDIEEFLVLNNDLTFSNEEIKKLFTALIKHLSVIMKMTARDNYLFYKSVSNTEYFLNKKGLYEKHQYNERMVIYKSYWFFNSSLELKEKLLDFLKLKLPENKFNEVKLILDFIGNYQVNHNTPLIKEYEKEFNFKLEYSYYNDFRKDIIEVNDEIKSISFDLRDISLLTKDNRNLKLNFVEGIHNLIILENRKEEIKTILKDYLNYFKKENSDLIKNESEIKRILTPYLVSFTI